MRLLMKTTNNIQPLTELYIIAINIDYSKSTISEQSASIIIFSFSVSL